MSLHDVGDISLTLRVAVNGIDTEVRLEWLTLPENVESNVHDLLFGVGPQTLYDRWNNIQTGGIKK